MNQINWTKLDVSIINRKLSKLNVYEHKGVVFYKTNQASNDPFDVGLAETIDYAGGACYIYMSIDAIDLIVKEETSAMGDQIKKLATVDEHGKFLMIAFDEKSFQSKHNHLREFVIAHEMAHIHFQDHLDMDDRVNGLSMSNEKELRADKYAVELLDSKYEALAFFKMVLEGMARVELMEFPLENLGHYNMMKKNLQARQYAVNK